MKLKKYVDPKGLSWIEPENKTCSNPFHKYLKTMFSMLKIGNDDNDTKEKSEETKWWT